MKKRPLLMLLATLLIGYCCLHYSCKPKNCCCDLPAPDSLTATVTGPTTATLDWAPVPGAVAYRVTVKDITSDSTLPPITTIPDSLLLTGLTPNHDYTAIVQAICDTGKACPVSPNGAAVCFKGFIIVDVVVMREIGGTGMSDCDECGSSFTSTSGDFSLNLTFPTNPTNPRLVFKLKIVTPLGLAKYFKLAFDKNCIHEIKGYDCPLGGVSFSQSGNTDLTFSESSSLFLTLTPDSNGLIKVRFEPGCLAPNCTVSYVQCTGTWTGCQ